MTNTIQERLAILKGQFGNYELTDEDYYETDDVASCDTDSMFQYFRNELDESEQSQLLKCAAESKLFLHDLISVGETLLADQHDDAPTSYSTSWADFSSLPTTAPSVRNQTLDRSQGLRMNLASTHALAADSGALDITCELPFGAEANVYEDGDQLVIKVSSDDTSRGGQLVGYCLSGKDQDRLGFIMLRAGVLGTVSGIARLDRSPMSGEQILNFETVDASDLGKADFALLEEAVVADLEDERSVEAWRRWIASVSKSEDGPALEDGLQRLQLKLG